MESLDRVVRINTGKVYFCLFPIDISICSSCIVFLGLWLIKT